jgi:hypothetical protein
VRIPAQIQSLRLTKAGHAFVLIAALTILIVGVVGFRFVSSTPSYSVATWSRPVAADTVPEARALTKVGGVLRGRTNADGTACFWLGSDPDWVALMWPPRYSAHGSPLTIMNQDGQAVGTVGQIVNLDGSVAAPEDIQAKRIFGCPRMSSVELVV